MPRLIKRIICYGVLACTIGLSLIWLGAHLFTGTSQWARAFVWMDSDINDYQRFPARPIFNAPPRFDFKPPAAEIQQRYAPVFDTVTFLNKGRYITQDFEQFLEGTDTVAFLVIKDDVLLYEGYFDGYNHDSTVTSFSVAKSFISALVGIAISEGYIHSLDDPITRYVPELLEKDPRYAAITLRNLLTMTSGLRYEETARLGSDGAITYYGTDLRAVALSSPIVAKPGKAFHYNNYNPLLVGLMLERATGRPVAEYLEEKIWRPLGMETTASWSLDSQRSSFEKMVSGINARAIDFAKFGRLYLHQGNWNGVQLIPAEWVEESTRRDTTSDPAENYQYFWWINCQVPDEHHFFAAGKYGQYIYIVPAQDLILVPFGKADPYGWWKQLFATMTRQIAAIP